MPRTVGPAMGEYRMSQLGGVTSGLRSYRFLFDNCGVTLDKIQYNHKHNVLRIFPCKDPEDPNCFLGSRYSNEPNDFTGWIRRYPAVVGFGNPATSWIVADPRDETYDPATTPVNLLHRSVQAAVTAGQFPDPRWAAVVAPQQGRNGPLHPTTDVFLVQGMAMMLGSKAFQTPKGSGTTEQLQVYYLSKSAGQALLTRLNETDANGNPVLPDIVDINAGMFVDIFQAGTPPLNAAPMQQGPVGTLGSLPRPGGLNVGGGGGSQADQNSYDVEFLDRFTGAYGTIGPSIAAVDWLLSSVRAKVRPWDEIVRVSTIPEQIAYICRSGIPPTAIVFGLAEMYREHIPAEVMDAYIRQPSSPGMAFQQPGFAPPQQGGFAPPPQQGGFAPPPTQPQGGFSQPLPTAQATVPQQGGFAPPPQQGFAPPPQAGAPQTAPGFPQPQFSAPGTQTTQPTQQLAQPAQQQQFAQPGPTPPAAPAAAGPAPANGQGFDQAPPDENARRNNAMAALKAARDKGRQPVAS